MIAFALGIGLWILAALFAVFYIIPITNKILSRIWTDPTHAQKPEVLKRMQELMVDGDVPAETAVMMTAQENKIQQEVVLEIMNASSASDVKNMLTGKSGFLSVFSQALGRKMKRGAGRRRR